MAAVVLVGAGVTVTILATQGSNKPPEARAAGPASSAATTTRPETANTGDNEDGGGEGAESRPGGSGMTSEDPAVIAAPTGVPYTSSDQVNVGDCADFMPVADGTALHRADCADASVILDQIVETDTCPMERFAAYDRGDGLHCFRWLLDVGDCVSGQKWNRVPCSSNIPDPSILQVLETHVGESDGRLCDRPEHYLQWGNQDNHGIVCVLPLHQITSNGENRPRSTE